MNELIKYEDSKIVVADEVIKKLRKLEEKRLEIELTMKTFKEDLLELMEQNDMKESFEIGNMKVAYKKATQRTTLDTKKVKEELPDVFEKYSKTSDVKSSISIEFI